MKLPSNQRTWLFAFEGMKGIARASRTLRNVRGAWVKEQRVDVKDGKITEYQVNLMVTFVLDD